MKQKFIDAYIDVAERFAQLSSAKRLQVGAIVVKDDRIISIGYNGMPAGWNNDCEYKEYMSNDAGGWLSAEEILEGWPYEGTYLDANGNTMQGRYKLKTKPEVLHAESNALDKLAKRGGVGGADASMFITHAPCLECAKSIYGAGIKNVYFRQQYRSDDGVEFLKKCSVNVSQHDNV